MYFIGTTNSQQMFTLTILYGWNLRQLDINNDFLNGVLIEEVFMHNHKVLCRNLIWVWCVNCINPFMVLSKTWGHGLMSSNLPCIVWVLRVLRLNLLCSLHILSRVKCFDWCMLMILSLRGRVLKQFCFGWLVEGGVFLKRSWLSILFSRHRIV